MDENDYLTDVMETYEIKKHQTEQNLREIKLKCKFTCIDEYVGTDTGICGTSWKKAL